MTKKPIYKLPHEFKEEDREPVSARVKKSTKVALEKAAEESGLSLALVVSNILDSYVDWMKEQNKK